MTATGRARRLVLSPLRLGTVALCVSWFASFGGCATQAGSGADPKAPTSKKKAANKLLQGEDSQSKGGASQVLPTPAVSQEAPEALPLTIPPLAGGAAGSNVSDVSEIACTQVCSHLWGITAGTKAAAKVPDADVWTKACVTRCRDFGSQAQLDCFKRVRTAPQIANCQSQ